MSHITTLRNLRGLGLTDVEICALVRQTLLERSVEKSSSSKTSIPPHLGNNLFQNIAAFFKNLFSKKQTKPLIPERVTKNTTANETKPGANKKSISVSKKWTRNLTGLFSKKAIKTSLIVPASTSLRREPTKGLPNFASFSLINVCYMNAAVQMIANIPNLKRLVENADVENKADHIKALKQSLTLLIQTMENPSSERSALISVSENFWGAFQDSLANEPMEGLRAGRGCLNDSTEFLTYLGEMLDIDTLKMGPRFDTSRAFRSAQESTTGKATPEQPPTGDVLVIDIDERRNFSPKEFITIGEDHFELCGIINHGGSHYTGCTKSADGSWNNYNDDWRVNKGKQHYGPRVVVYQKI